MARADWYHSALALQSVPSGGGEIVVLLERWHVAWLIGMVLQAFYPSSWENGRDDLLLMMDGIEDLVDRLMGVSLDDIGGKLDEIIVLLGNLPTGGICCPSGGGLVIDIVRQPDPLELPVPDPVVDGGWATDPSDVDGMENYLCNAADLIIDNMVYKVRRLKELFGTAVLGIQTVAALLAYFAGNGVIAAIQALLADAAGVIEEIQGFADAGVFDLAEAALEDMREWFRCMVKEGQSVAEAMQLIRAYLQGVDPVVSGFIGFLGWEPVIAGVYSGVDANGDSLVDLLGEPMGCLADCATGVYVDAAGVDANGWLTGDFVHVGQEMLIGSYPDVFGQSPSQETIGQVWPSGSTLKALMSIYGEGVGSDTLQSAVWTDVQGVEHDLTLEDLVAGVLVDMTGWRLVMANGYGAAVVAVQFVHRIVVMSVQEAPV